MTTESGKKRRWYHNIADAYRVTSTHYPWMRWVLPLIFVVVLALFIWWGVASGHWIFYPILGIVMALTAMLVVLSLWTRKASYLQIEGQPGASLAVLQQLRGWNTDDEPVGVNPRSGDMAFRSIGPGGVVIAVEGPINRTRRLARNEEKKVKLVLREAPVHIFHVGDADGQVTLAQLEKHVRKLPKKLNKGEIAIVAKRLRSMGTLNLGIPKGIDPLRARPDRRGMRGR
ncbi:MAG: DUF4191 domain-containing protein [Bowdeniella nasicola]|nr:DUF4191 domain-containing protein [Bowdeniella nasicola]